MYTVIYCTHYTLECALLLHYTVGLLIRYAIVLGVSSPAYILQWSDPQCTDDIL